MSAKKTSQYVCQNCSYTTPKWMGQCESCGEWNSFEEVKNTPLPANGKKTYESGDLKNFFTPLSDIQHVNDQTHRYKTNFEEFNRVCGGGLVPGSVILLGGEPGIGKSTLLLQLLAHLSQSHTCAYISGEEAKDQVYLRAKRLGLNKMPCTIANTTSLEKIITALDQAKECQCLVIDSIQTIESQDLNSSAGSVSQVKACAQELIQYAKAKNICVIMVGHITKDGAFAGPKVLEHMVDTVLYFEGDNQHHYRLLRAVKNRFGATDEVGIFSMEGEGLLEVPNPSQSFITNHEDLVSGSAVFAGIEGTRSILCEVQALVTPSFLPSPRRTAVGWDYNRLSMILAVLESRAGLRFSNKDVYLTFTGGLKIKEPASDLAVAAALYSSLKNRPWPQGAVFFGEIGLSGDVRPVKFLEKRLKESEKLGFKHLYAGGNADDQKKHSFKRVTHISKLFQS